MSARSVIKRWIMTTLDNDTALSIFVADRIFDSAAPQGSPEPYVVIVPPNGMTDTFYVGARRIWTGGLWTVKAVGAGRNEDDLEPIADRIDVLLNRASGSDGAGGTVHECVRTLDLGYLDDSEPGEYHTHLGGQYRIRAS